MLILPICSNFTLPPFRYPWDVSLVSTINQPVPIVGDQIRARLSSSVKPSSALWFTLTTSLLVADRGLSQLSNVVWWYLYQHGFQNPKYMLPLLEAMTPC